jgi:hypothetical protein
MFEKGQTGLFAVVGVHGSGLPSRAGPMLAGAAAGLIQLKPKPWAHWRKVFNN